MLRRDGENAFPKKCYDKLTAFLQTLQSKKALNTESVKEFLLVELMGSALNIDIYTPESGFMETSEIKPFEIGMCIGWDMSCERSNTHSKEEW